MRYLVTGGAGFIGSNVVRQLVAQGHSVRIVDNLSSGHLANLEDLFPKIDFRREDITHQNVLESAVEEVDCVIHLAAQVSVPQSFLNPGHTQTTNVLATAQLLKVAQLAGVKSLLFASSCSVYGDPAVVPTDESSPLQPKSPYASSKQQAEELLISFQRHQFKTISFRFFNVYGAGQDPHSPYAAAIPSFVNCLTQGKRPTIFGDGTQTRDFIHVSDVASTLVLASLHASEFEHPVYNLCTGKAFSVVEVLSNLAKLWDRPYDPTFAPGRTGDIHFSCGSKDRIAQSLKRIGYSFQPKLIHEGLALWLQDMPLSPNQLPTESSYFPMASDTQM